jgi:hypothetical protein
MVYSVAMTKNISAHVTSLLSAAAGAIALIHPGFTIPPFVQGLTVTICTAVAAGIQLAHMNFKHQMAAIENLAKRTVDTAVENLSKSKAK